MVSLALGTGNTGNILGTTGTARGLHAMDAERDAAIAACFEHYQNQWGAARVQAANTETDQCSVNIGPCAIQKWAARHIAAAGVVVATDGAHTAPTDALSSDIMIISNLAAVRQYSATEFSELKLPDMDNIVGFMAVLDASVSTHTRTSLSTRMISSTPGLSLFSFLLAHHLLQLLEKRKLCFRALGLPTCSRRNVSIVPVGRNDAH